MKIDSPTFLTETTFISASVQFSSGSQKFGDTSDDIHQFTGSVCFGGPVTASSNISGSSTSTGSFGTLQIGNQHIFGDSDGIGIGIANPAHKLDVSGNANGNFAARIINAHSNGLGLMVRGGASSNNRGISLENSTQATVWKANLDGTTVQTNTLEVTSGNISGSATSTGSFGAISVGG